MSISKLKIPKQLYIGLWKSYNDIPSGIMVPYSTDKYGLQRQSNVDKRAEKSFKKTVIDNIPLAGFRLTSTIDSGNYGFQDIWRIEDPRGFEIDIKGYNFAKILSECTVHNGEILDTCVWARSSGNNYLLPINSNDYIDAIEQENISSKKVSIKNVSPGDYVVLRNGDKGTYLGRLACLIMNSTRNYSDQLYNNLTTHEMLHTILLDYPQRKWSKTGSKRLKFSSTLQPSSFTKGPGMTDIEREAAAIQELSSKTTYIEHPAFGKMISCTTEKNKNIDWKLSIEENDSHFDPFIHKNTRITILALTTKEVGILYGHSNKNMGQMHLIEPDPFYQNNSIIPIMESTRFSRFDDRKAMSFIITDVEKTYSVYIITTLSDGTENKVLITV